ncbi:MAG: carbohydrate-binding domain-containing protein [Synergistaceae bacterium]|nr:carbohydrate-binding domain-containing protein [Synergistaceae bacterium]
MNVKKFSNIVYVLILGMFVLSLSGCGGSSNNNNNNSTTTASKLMVVRSAAFVSGDTYQIYKGNNVSVLEEAVKTKKLYVAPAASGAEINTLNLQFSGTASNDEPFVITKSDGQTVVVAYNPSGTGTDTTTTTVTRYGGGTQQQKYTGLTISSVSGSELIPSGISVEGTPVVVTLKEDGTATYSYEGVSQGSVPTNDFIWAISEDVAGEYWVQNGEIIDDADNLTITSSDGLYIANDIVYVPDTLNFLESQTVTKANGTAEGDSDKLYVAYYSAEAVGTANKYIVAALPDSMGMGGTPGGDMGTPPNQSSQGGTPPEMPGSNFRASAGNFDSIVEAMTHSAAEAKKNPVLHITKSGSYKLKGTWNGQIWIDIPDYSTTSTKKTKKDSDAKVLLILDGVTVKCTVAPALVFKKVYECGPSDSADVKADYKTLNTQLLNEGDLFAGAAVVIADGTTNTFTGTNVARLNDVTVNTDDGYTTSDVGNYVKAQEKLYKLDGAFHSRMSMVIGLEDGATSGTLNVDADYEGLDSEMHMLINSGTINVTADDDGINVNEDNMSVFYLEGGTVTVKSSGGDGIDSNGYVVATGGKLYISAGSTAIGAAGESGIDADKYVEITDNAAYYWAQAGSTNWTLQNSYSGTSENAPQQTNQPTTNDQQTTTNQETTTQQQTTTQSNTETAIDSNGNTTTVTFQATTSDTKLGYRPVDERTAAEVATSGTNFKVLSGYNDFAGITNN